MFENEKNMMEELDTLNRENQDLKIEMEQMR